MTNEELANKCKVSEEILIEAVDLILKSMEQIKSNAEHVITALQPLKGKPLDLDAGIKFVMRSNNIDAISQKLQEMSIILSAHFIAEKLESAISEDETVNPGGNRVN